MPRFGLIGPSYEAESPNLDAQKTMNFYPEIDESGAGNAPIALMPTPGIKSFVDLNPYVPPVEFLDAQLISAVGFSTAGGGIYPGDNTWEYGPFSSAAIQIDDIVFLSFDGSVESGRPYNPILSIVCNAALGNMNQLGITLDQGTTNGARRFFQVFWCKATTALAANMLSYVATFATPPHAGSVPDALFILGVVQVRNLTNLEQENHSTANSNPVLNPSLIIADKKFYGSFIGPAQENISIVNNTIFNVRIGNHFAAGFRVDPILGTIFDLLAGNYQPIWTNVPGGNLALINCVFGLKPA